MNTGVRLPEGFTEEIKDRIRLSDVIGKTVKLKRSGKEFVGLSPFTSEKSPSFYVIDEKRIFHDFSSGKSGDVFTWFMEMERLTFMEAVERAAAEAGMAMPKADPKVAAEISERERLMKWTEAACAWFEEQLRGPDAKEARTYLTRRGLPPESWGKYRLGYAPAGWRGLIDAMKAKGAKVEDLIQAGLAQPGKEGREPYDAFRDRVIFPIEDVRGKVVAFGGRVMQPDVKPKYINSAEGPLFHKGHQIYHYRRARTAMASANAPGLIVCEGYMDVIALSEAGYGHAVAPLGTALTEDQLRLIWQAGPEPVLCFDGDAAGLRAAFRAIDRAMPFVEPGRSLFFALLPEGQDPDDYIRNNGRAAMGEVLSTAIPLVDMLWQRERDAEPLDTPERQAGLEARLTAAVQPIKHTAVRSYYERELKSRSRDLFFEMRRAARTAKAQPGERGGFGTKSAPGNGDGRNSARDLGLIQSARGMRVRSMGLLVRCVETPPLLDQAIEPLAAAEFPDPDIERIRDAIFDVLEACGKVDREAVARHLRNLGNTRSVRLLDMYPKAPPLDLMSADGREWLGALERFAAEAGLREESRRVRSASAGAGEDGGGDFVRSHEEWRRLVAERHALRVQAREQAERTDGD